VDNKNITDLEQVLNKFEVELDTKDMQINHMLTKSPESVGDDILLIIQYGPKSKEEIIGTETPLKKKIAPQILQTLQKGG
jgi:hypothetical protein